MTTRALTRRRSLAARTGLSMSLAVATLSMQAAHTPANC